MALFILRNYHKTHISQHMGKHIISSNITKHQSKLLPLGYQVKILF